MRSTTPVTPVTPVLVLFLAVLVSVVAVAAGNGTPKVCKCSGGGSCGLAQLVDTSGVTCPTPINGVLNASVVTSEATNSLNLNLTGVKKMLGYLSVEFAPQLTALVTPDLVTVGSLKVRSNKKLVSVSFPALTHFEGVPESSTLTYYLDIRSNTKLNSASFPNLTEVKGGVTCEDANLTNPCSLPALTTVTGNYHMKGGDHGKLVSVTGKLSVSGVDDIKLPALMNVGGDFDVTLSGKTFVGLSTPSLVTIGGGFKMTDIITPFTNTLCKKIDLPRLTSVLGAGGLTIEGMTALYNFSAAELVNVTAGAVKIHSDGLRHVYLDNLMSFKYIDVKGKRGGPSVMTHGPCVAGGLASGASSAVNNAYGVKDYPVMEMYPKGCEHTPKPPTPTTKIPPSAPAPSPILATSGGTAPRVVEMGAALRTAAIAATAAISVFFCFFFA